MQPHRIGILKPSSLGDIIQCLAILPVIKRHYPSSHIDWIIDEGLSSLLAHNPHASAVPIISKGLKKRKRDLFKTIATLRQLPKYDILLDLHGSIKSSIFSLFIKKDIYIGFSRHSIKEKIAACAYDKSYEIDFYENIYIRNLSLSLQALEINENPKDILDSQEPFLFYDPTIVSTEIRSLIHPNEPNILLIIGASTRVKIYPTNKLAQVCEQIQVHFIVVWGSESERVEAEALAHKCSRVSVAPKVDFNDLSYLCDCAALCIGNDTGPSHFAFALGKPSLLLFGNTPNERIVYPTATNKSLKSPSKVDALKIDKNDFSIQDIEVSEIVSLAKSLLWVSLRPRYLVVQMM